MRLFVAADLPASMRERLAGLLLEMRQFPLPTRWVRAESIHLTLRFIGEVPAAGLDAIRGALRGIPRGAGEPLRLRAEGIGVFPQRGAPRVVWVDVRGEREAAARLAGAIDAALVGIGLPAEKRAFTPHLTLGRVRGRGRGDWRGFLERFANWSAGDLVVSGFHLFESRLGPGGASYHVVDSFGIVGEDV